MIRHIARAVTTVQSTGVPLWALVVVVIGGTVILVTGLVFALIFAQRSRRRRRRRRHGEKKGYRKRRLVIDGREVNAYRDGSSDGGGRSRCSSSSKSEWGQRARSGSGKLRKKQQQQQQQYRGRGQEDDEDALAGAGMMGGYVSAGEMDMVRSVSPASPTMTGGWKWGSRSSLPPVLPQLFTGGKRFSMSLFSVVSLGSRGERTGSGHGQEQDGGGGGRTPQFHLPRRQTSNAWIDEDAIHGPVMSPTASPSRHGRASGSGRKKKTRSRGSWRASLTFSDSWPLKSISPTLPRLSHFGSPKPRKAEVDDLGIRQPPPAVTAPAPTPTTTILHRPGSGSGAAALPVYRLQSGSHYHHNHQQLRNHAVPNLPVPGSDSGQDYSPPRQLPKPPRQALLAANAEVAGIVAQGRSNSWHSGSGMRTPMGQGQYVTQNRPTTSHAYYVHEDTSAGATTPTANSSPSRSAARVSPGTRGRRVVSTDSELSQILKGTERRLQEGVITGSGASTGTRRSRTSVSPPKRALAPSAMGRAGSFTTVAGMETNESSATLIGTTSRTPSPPKQHQGRLNGRAGPGHTREGSQSSVLSDPDSLLVDLAPGPEHYHGLTSPSSPTKSVPGQTSRGYQPQLMRRPSIAISVASSVESALSDIDERYSEDAAEETLIKSSLGTSHLTNGTKRGSGFTRGNNQSDDPFVSLHSSSSLGGERATRGRTLPVPPPSRIAHAFNDAPRLQGGPPNRSDITVHALRSESPLSTISGNSGSPDLRPRALSISHEKKSPVVVYKTQASPQQQSQRVGKAGAVYAPVAPTSAVSSSSNLHKRQLSIVPDIEVDDDGNDDDDGYDNAPNVAGLSIPGLSLTSPSEKDKDSPAAKTANDMRARPSSPTLGRSREKTPDMLPPSPALPRHTPRLSSLYEFNSDQSADARSISSAGARRRAAGEVRRISDDSVASSRYSDLERLRVSILREAASREALLLYRNSGSSSTGVGAGWGATQAVETLRLVPPEDGSRAGLPSTVAQLRRMNSQVSTTYHSDGSANNSPVLPTLREEGTGRFVSPPRKREAAKNYLSLGSAPSSVGRGSDAGGRYSVGDHNNKENERAGLEVKRVKADVGDNSVLRPGPGRTFEASTKSLVGLGQASPQTQRQSSESLGLYDADGFLISPERRRTHR